MVIFQSVYQLRQIMLTFLTEITFSGQFSGHGWNFGIIGSWHEIIHMHVRGGSLMYMCAGDPYVLMRGVKRGNTHTQMISFTYFWKSIPYVDAIKQILLNIHISKCNGKVPLKPKHWLIDCFRTTTLKKYHTPNWTSSIISFLNERIRDMKCATPNLVLLGH